MLGGVQNLMVRFMDDKVSVVSCQAVQTNSKHKCVQSVKLLRPVTEIAGSIPVSWSSAKWFGLETLSKLVALILCYYYW